MPALLTSRPIAGWRAVTAAATRSTASRSETSQVSHSPPISFATASSRSARRASRTQCQPRRESRRAVSAPIPLDAPVTTATRTDLASGLAADADAAQGLRRPARRVDDDRVQHVAALRRAPRLPRRPEDVGRAAGRARDAVLAVEEVDAGHLLGRAGEHDEPRLLVGADPGAREEPAHGRPVHAADPNVLEGRVRQHVVAGLV